MTLDKGVNRKSDALKELSIAVGVCGGIGAVEIIKIIRELRRHGAVVTPFMTPGAQRFITPLSVEWAANRRVVLEEGPDVEYLDRFDAVLIAPATLNTIHKSAYGITDNAVLLMIATQIARRGKLLFVPAMNGEMAKHPLFKETQDRLGKWGARFFESPLDEDRLKMPEAERLAEWILEILKKD